MKIDEHDLDILQQKVQKMIHISYGNGVKLSTTIQKSNRIKRGKGEGMYEWALITSNMPS